MNSSEIILLLFLVLWAVLSSSQAWTLFIHGKANAFPLVVVLFLFADLGIMIRNFLGDDLLCESPVAYGSTISRISASIVSEGYVFMMVSLSILNLIFLRELGVITANRQDKFAAEVPGNQLASISELMIRIGFGLTLLTAVLPDRATNSELVEGGKHFADRIAQVHMIGIQAGIVISTIGCLLRYKVTVGLLGESWFSLGYIKASILIMSFGGVVLLCFMGLFTYYEGNATNSPQNHICINYRTKGGCEGSIYTERNLTLPDDWPCEWNAAAPLTRFACTNPSCEDYLEGNRFALVFEYLLLLYWVLVCSFSLRMVDLVEVEQYYKDHLVEGARQSARSLLGSGDK